MENSRSRQGGAEDNANAAPGGEIERLEAELRTTRQRLQAANEELETSRGELQSLNEELTTVNDELAHRVQELTRTTSDLKNLLESTQIATLFLDNDMHVTNFTPAVTAVLHLAETDLGRPLAQIDARLPVEQLHDDIRRVLRTLVVVERELAAPDHGIRYMVKILPYRSVDNRIAGVVITFVDITAIARGEERQRLLLAELQHRVRNTLSVIRSIARRTAQSAASVEDFTAHFDGRINAFARTQALVTRDPGVGLDLEFVLAEELLAYNAQDGGQVSLHGPPVRLQPRPAETFALAVHELATNAAKYGALSRPGGRIAISWRVERDGATPALVFEWQESGGPKVAPPRRQGFGTEILERTLAFEFKAEMALAFPPQGFRCTIRIPASGKVFQSLPVSPSP